MLPRPRSNREWGYRNTTDIEAAAANEGLTLIAIEDMPANNHYMLFEKSSNAQMAANV